MGNIIIKLRKTMLFAAFSIVAQIAGAQITIDECILLARKNYPVYKEHELTDMGEDCDLKSSRLKWAPQLSFNAKATYQSEVVEMPFTIPGYEFDISHFQYGATADVSQMIWDGGAVRNNREKVRANADVSRRQLDVTLYSLNERVENLFLGILLLDRQIEQNKVLMESLFRKKKDVEACLESGVAYKSDVDIVSVNILNCRQQEVELENNREAYLKMLGKLVGRDLTNEKFVEPDVDTGYDNLEIRRPELSLYDAQLFQNSVQDKELKTRISPKFNLTFQGGIGRPGLNMLKDELQPYYLAGVKMQWDIGSLYSFRNDRKKVELKRKNIEYERETFMLNTSLDVTEQLSAIDKIREALRMDDDIISMRERIRLAGEEQYANGVIKMIDLMTMIDDEHNARLNKSVHEVQLMMAVRKLDNITGKQQIK